ncbi:MAG: hypothetical protein NC548_25185 [Lachnospiraceae bacterium]|nr:hypothetical protein [Lachnospiraceae bacterium]
MFKQEMIVLDRYCSTLDYADGLAVVKEDLELVVLYLRVGFYDLACLYIDFLAVVRDEMAYSVEIAEAVDNVITGIIPYKN